MTYNNSTYNSGQPYKPPYKTYNAGASKTNAIKTFQDNKERSIRSYTADKDVSIVVSGAIRDAYLMVCNDPNFKLDITSEERRSWVERMVIENIEFVAKNRESWEDLYSRVRKAGEDLRLKVEEDVLIEEGTDDIGTTDGGTGQAEIL